MDIVAIEELIFFQIYFIIKMYLIELHFVSDVQNVFTKHVETANDEHWFLLKLERLLNNWLKILSPYKEKTHGTQDCDFPYAIEKKEILLKKYMLIQQEVFYMNQTNMCDRERSFVINVYQGEKLNSLNKIDFF